MACLKVTTNFKELVAEWIIGGILTMLYGIKKLVIISSQHYTWFTSNMSFYLMSMYKMSVKYLSFYIMSAYEMSFPRNCQITKTKECRMSF